MARGVTAKMPQSQDWSSCSKGPSPDRSSPSRPSKPHNLQPTSTLCAGPQTHSPEARLRSCLGTVQPSKTRSARPPVPVPPASSSQVLRPFHHTCLHVFKHLVSCLKKNKTKPLPGAEPAQRNVACVLPRGALGQRDTLRVLGPRTLCSAPAHIPLQQAAHRRPWPQEDRMGTRQASPGDSHTAPAAPQPQYSQQGQCWRGPQTPATTCRLF